MAKKRAVSVQQENATLPTHGALSLPLVEIESYSLELEDEDGFAGDKANKGAFVRILDELRKPLAKLGEDPLGSKRTDQIGRKKLAAILAEGDPEAAALVQVTCRLSSDQSPLRKWLRSGRLMTVAV